MIAFQVLVRRPSFLLQVGELVYKLRERSNQAI